MAVLFNPFLIPIVAIAGYFLYRIVDSCNKSHAETVKHKADAELKITLAQRGMSPSEIERVVMAGRDQATGAENAEPAEYQFTTPLPPNKRPSQPSHRHFAETQGY